MAWACNERRLKGYYVQRPHECQPLPPPAHDTTLVAVCRELDCQPGDLLEHMERKPGESEAENGPES